MVPSWRSDESPLFPHDLFCIGPELLRQHFLAQHIPLCKKGKPSQCKARQIRGIIVLVLSLKIHHVSSRLEGNK